MWDKILRELSNLLFEKLVRRIPDRVFRYITFRIKNRRIPCANTGLINDYLYYQKENELMVKNDFFSKQQAKELASALDDKIKIIDTLFTLHDIRDLNYLKEREIDLIFKSNIGSQSNVILFKNDRINWQFELLISMMLRRDFYSRTREKQYKGELNSIIVEPLLMGGLNDFKVFCFNGLPKILQVDFARFEKHTRNFYDFNTFEFLDIQWSHPNNLSLEIDKYCFELLREHCLLLSQPFQFIRLDFYIIDAEVYFGEFTLNPGNANERFAKKEQEELFSNILFG